MFWRTWLAACLAVVACSESAVDSRPRADPARTLAILQRWIAARAARDAGAMDRLLAETVVSRAADPITAMALDGRAAVRDLAMKTERSCDVSIAIAGDDTAYAVGLCTVVFSAKREPTRREVKLIRAVEITVDAHGAIASIVDWADHPRMWRQLGVAFDATAEPDGPVPIAAPVAARRDAAETANSERARGLVAALDRRDTDAAARHVAPGFQLKDQARPAPQRFAAPGDFAAAMRDGLAPCEASGYQVQSTVAAGDWVAVKLSRSCRRLRTGKLVVSPHLWLIRFAGGLAVESWSFQGRLSELALAGEVTMEQVKAMQATL